jgi:pyrroloquinoline quinone biosynthesis protein E
MKQVRLAECVRTRREPFGGLIYDPRTGTTVELDRGAHRLLELARCGISLDEARAVIRSEGSEPGFGDRDMQVVVRMLGDLGLVVPGEANLVASNNEHAVSREVWPSGPHLSAPEAVHWAITYRCHSGCPDCYTARHRGVDQEMNTSRALEFIEGIAHWGVFQLAIGGGEPLLRDDLEMLVRRAADRGLSVHVTTSGDLLTRDKMNALCGSLTCLQVGIRHSELLGARPIGQVSRLSEVSGMAREAGVALGANLILCRSVLERFEDAIHVLFNVGFRRITLLRYKPPASLEQWDREAPSGNELSGVEERIDRIVSRHPGLAVRLDCALSFLQRRLSTEVARKHGLRGCVAGSRIIALIPNGSIYPCSQLVDPRFRAGNILEDDPRAIWSGSAVLLGMRSFRAHRGYHRSTCGMCRAVDQCGGCRVFTHEGFGLDPDCPGPVPVPDGTGIVASGIVDTEG